MNQPFLALVRRLETAQAVQNERFNAASGGTSLPVGGGFAHHRGEGHPLNQALGLVDPVSEAELEALEAFLGSPTVLELSPGADPALWPLLARRGYRVHEFMQLLTRPLPGEALPEPSAEVRVATLEEGDLFSRLVAGAFLERDDWRDHESPFGFNLDVEEAWGFIACCEGEPAGGGVLGLVGGVALLSGDGVLPRFRGRGLQKALVQARLGMAVTRGCDIACASTLPGTASQRAYQSCGFGVAYPKLEMARGGA